jgi:hypothetical protein
MTRSEAAQGLTSRERRFAELFVIYGSAAKAYEESYGHEGPRGSGVPAKIRDRQDVSSYIAWLYEQRAAEDEPKRAAIEAELRALAFSDIGDVIERVPNDEPGGGDCYRIRDLEKLSKAARSCIKRISSRATQNGPHIVIELHDKVGAIDRLCKLYGFDARGLTDDLPSLTDDQIRSAMLEAAERMTH